MKRLSAAVLCLTFLAGCTPTPKQGDASAWQPFPTPGASALEEKPFGASVSYAETPVTIHPAIAADFSVGEITNFADMESAYGFTFSEADKAFLQENKFFVKQLLDTSIRPRLSVGHGAAFREFLALYNKVRGPNDAKDRTQANALFFSSDIFFHSYNLLFVELLKEMENTVFFPSMKELAKTFYEEARQKAQVAPAAEKARWVKVQNYFAVAHTLFSTAQTPLTEQDYISAEGVSRGNPDEIRQAWEAADKTADALEAATAFAKGLALDAESERVVLADLGMVYKAQGREVPAMFEEEYEKYREDVGISFQVDATQFTPRSHYTGLSLRRQYFRGMMWFSQVPLFLKSPALTTYAFAASQLLAENPQQLADYGRLEKTINFLVGESDDLMPVDYLTALARAKDAPDQEAAVMETLAKMRDPQIKGIPATYATVGDVETADVLLLTKGMRFMSQKFIIDSYWTGQLTQGDEKPKPGYTQKLPPMASSLEVMALLGSDYARSKIPTLDFYTPDTKEAIDKAMADLTAETATLDDAFWTKNVYNGWLWTIRSLFAWQKEQGELLPRFMQSAPWAVKTLQTASGFWTELRHATLLYAKQSFAELGGGPPACDAREVPPPPKGYIEPQLEAYDRLIFLAKRTEAGLSEQQFVLRNIEKLQRYIEVMETVRGYVVRQLQNTAFAEKTKQVRGADPYDETKECVSHAIDGASDWETLRTAIVDGLASALPEPVDGPILSAKDQRAAVLADIHTGGDSANPTRVLYEGVGVPSVLFVAVKDANGPRLTVGFAYAHYEFTEPYGDKRLTDEQWQEKFYKGDDAYDAFGYTPSFGWPAANAWYVPLSVAP